MKKLLTIIVAILMLVSVVAVSASAYGRRQNAECKANNTSFADTDNNGICDNRESSVKAQNNECNGNGTGFVDTDNNGVCDNRKSSVKAQNNECNGNGNGLHCGKNR